VDGCASPWLTASKTLWNAASDAAPDQCFRSTPCRSPKNSGGSQASTNTCSNRPCPRAERASALTLSLATAAGDQATITSLAAASSRTMVASHAALGAMSWSHQTPTPSARSASTSRPTVAKFSRL